MAIKRKAKPRVYTDTSAIGGCFDSKFARDSLQLIDMAHRGQVLLLLSDVVIAELEDAPQRVRDVLTSLPESTVEAIAITTEILELRDAYLKAGIVGPKWTDDATHVAAASVSRADAIVSWNFKHIVRRDKIKAYNEINQKNGYAELRIITPSMVAHEKKNDDRRFDSVAAKRLAQARIYQEIKNLTPQQEIAYFESSAESGNLRNWWKRIKESNVSNSHVRRSARTG